MKKMLIVLFGVLAFQSYVFAETWEDRAANKVAWSAENPDDPACWNPPVGWNTDNPWIVGKGDHEAYYGLANCVGPAPKMTPVTKMVGRIRLQRQRHVSCGASINLDMFVC